VARQLTISSPGTTGLPTMGGGSDQPASNQSPAMIAETENLCVLVFEPLLSGFESSVSLSISLLKCSGVYLQIFQGQHSN
jgi:hypothetical protein